jgi:hypothetical protein
LFLKPVVAWLSIPYLRVITAAAPPIFSPSISGYDYIVAAWGNGSFYTFNLGLNKAAVELTGFDRAEVVANGWLSYPALSRLAQVAPLDMTQQMFFARCKGLHELWQRIPNGYLKLLLERAGCPKGAVRDLGSLRLLQALLNVLERLNAEEEASDAFASAREPEGWSDRNESMAPLFVNNDLRIADAHEAIDRCLTTLQQLGFDTANVNAGYGRALDFVLDGVVSALGGVVAAIEQLLRTTEAT